MILSDEQKSRATHRCVSDAPLFGLGPQLRADQGPVALGHAGKQVVNDLVVEVPLAGAAEGAGSSHGFNSSHTQLW